MDRLLSFTAQELEKFENLNESSLSHLCENETSLVFKGFEGIKVNRFLAQPPLQEDAGGPRGCWWFFYPFVCVWSKVLCQNEERTPTCKSHFLKLLNRMVNTKKLL